LTPRPRTNLVLYHGVLAPHASWRTRAVAHGRVETGSAAEVEPAALDDVERCPDPAPEAGSGPANATDRPGPSGITKPRHWSWANLMRRSPGDRISLDRAVVRGVWAAPDLQFERQSGGGPLGLISGDSVNSGV
jgi:hypothetical protein